MATHVSAEKRARQTEKARLRNRANMSAMKSATKDVHEALAKGDLANVDVLLKKAQSVIARTRRKGSIHLNNMSRRISRLTKAVAKAKASGLQPAPRKK